MGSHPRRAFHPTEAKMSLWILCFITLLAAGANSRHSAGVGFGPSGLRQRWGFHEVRPQAHTFWWLMDSPNKNKPLVMWLQGGPGGSSTAFGNFVEVGPWNLDLKPNEASWLNESNLWFVDNPVGTGFSYVESNRAFARDVETIASDLVTLSIQFFNNEAPDMQSAPFYVISESYGGKMAAAYGVALHKALKAGKLKCNFKGVVLGDSWISPMDYVLSWAPYLYATSMIDDEGRDAINNAALATQRAVDNGQWDYATNLWGRTEQVIMQKADSVDFYNILKKERLPLYYANSKEWSGLEILYETSQTYSYTLGVLMNGPVKKALRIPSERKFGTQSRQVFSANSGDFMKPVISTVDELLNLGYKVVVFNGQLDLIVDTIGTNVWVQKLKWGGLRGWNAANRMPLYDKGKYPLTGAFKKEYANFSYYWIMRAGHMVPHDQPEMGRRILKMITDQCGGILNPC